MTTKTKSKKWTDEDKIGLIELYNSDSPFRSMEWIAENLDRSVTACERQLNKIREDDNNILISETQRMLNKHSKKKVVVEVKEESEPEPEPEEPIDFPMPRTRRHLRGNLFDESNL